MTNTPPARKGRTKSIDIQVGKQATVMEIAIKKLLEIGNPYSSALRMWGHAQSLTRRFVAECVKNRRFEPLPLEHTFSLEEDAARIAYFVVHGWTDAIQLDFGNPELNLSVSQNLRQTPALQAGESKHRYLAQCLPRRSDSHWPIVDGNHRFAAAVYRKDPTILASVIGLDDGG